MMWRWSRGSGGGGAPASASPGPLRGVFWAAVPSAGRPPLPVPADDDASARRHVRHNVVALGIDFGLFGVGLSFASQSTILPAFAAPLAASHLIIPPMPALIPPGRNLPPLLPPGYPDSL